MIDKKWKWVAKDSCGKTYVFTDRPEPTTLSKEWIGDDLDFQECLGIILISGSWDKSLHEIIHHEDGKIEFRKDRPELKVDDPVFVRDRDGEDWKRRHFAQWRDTGDIEVWPYGHTSFTAPEDEELPVSYFQYKLP